MHNRLVDINQPVVFYFVMAILQVCQLITTHYGSSSRNEKDM